METSRGHHEDERMGLFRGKYSYMMPIMNTNDSSPIRVAAQIVSGVGFLGGGIILRDGTSARGLNTAATLWCCAAVGTLVGGGFLFQAGLNL